MRRDVRGRNRKKDTTDLIIKYTGIAIVILSIIVIALFVYSKNLNNEVKEGTLTAEQIAGLMGNKQENTQSVTSEIGKSVEESKNEIAENSVANNTSNSIANTANATNSTNSLSTDGLRNSTNTNTTRTTATTNSSNNSMSNNNANTVETSSNKEIENENNTEINFVKPVEGEIIRDFAMDNLIFSNTLQEWTTHSGIDIKADKTTVVKAAETGTVKTIKNDPRYGLTIIIEHENGFKTVYSNLLTSEFVVEGEKVEKGQSLGTVGNTAAFEIADEPHLHFEIIKDEKQVDPNIYLK